MRNPTLILIFIFLISVSGQLLAQENYEVRNIKFRGNTTLEKDFLLEQMVMKEVSWLEKVILNEEPFLYSEELIDVDLERLVRIYQSEGFLQVKPTITVVNVNDKKNKLNLLVEIEEGEPVTVDSIAIDFPEETGTVKIDSLSAE
jgi:outer membrane protein insertion porin family